MKNSFLDFRSSSMSECEYGQLEIEQVGGNKITFYGNVGAARNPIKFQFGTWPVGMSIGLYFLVEFIMTHQHITSHNFPIY
jgi:hypothetical protein